MCSLSYWKDMPKTGKTDAEWAGIMVLYAQGKYKFSTGARPGSKRWKAVLERILDCPLTPRFGQAVRTTDIFGKKIPCKCGYHEVSDITASLHLWCDTSMQTNASSSAVHHGWFFIGSAQFFLMQSIVFWWGGDTINVDNTHITISLQKKQDSCWCNYWQKKQKQKTTTKTPTLVV